MVIGERTEQKMKQYGNSARFRLLKWLHPVMMTISLLVCWLLYYVPVNGIQMPAVGHAGLMIVFLLVLYCLEKTYSALAVGLVHASELIYSQSLANLICDAFFYVAMSLYANCFLNVLPMMVLLGVQIALSIVWSVVANRIYYENYPPPHTAIVYQTEADLRRVLSIRFFAERFDVKKQIETSGEDEEKLYESLKDMQAVFIAGLPTVLRGNLAKYCVANGIKAYFIPELSEIIMAGAEHMSAFSEPVMKVQRTQSKTEYLAVKRVMDLMVSVIGLIVISPVMLITAAAIKLNDGGPVFYKQNRLTQNGKVFSILKFRSMNVNAEKDGVARLASENDSRITPIGKIIRATRIDELPQLINILRGDMSLVGPRPERPEIASEYEKTLPEFALRLQVKAGLTGVAQVYGRYNTEPYSKLQMDLMYINKISLRMDMKLLFATVKILFMKESTEGIQEGQRTAMAGKDKAA